MSLNHNATICRLKNVRPHTNADKLQLATVEGNQVIVSLDQKEGDVGVYFPVDSALSTKFLEANDLVARHDKETGKKISGGYFGASGRVKAQRLRKEKSEGFWLTLDSLHNFCNLVGAEDKEWKVGDTFDEIDGHKVCEKYITPATREAIRRGSSLPSNLFFHRHIDTAHLKKNMRDIPDGARLYITEKLHGTSGRLGLLPVEKKLSFWQKILSVVKGEKPLPEYKHLIGSRNMIQGVAEKFNGEMYRLNSVQSLIGNLHKGETIYYEIVGYEEGGKAIMPSVSTDVLDKNTRKELGLGKTVDFSYGCEPMPWTIFDEDSVEHIEQNEIYVYRITQQNQDGDLLELAWDQVKGRCSELGLKTVPEFSSTWFFNRKTEGIYINSDSLIELAEGHAYGLSNVDNKTVREGVVVRWEKDGKWGLLKLKSFEFLVLEGHIKSQETYVDKEESS